MLLGGPFGGGGGRPEGGVAPLPQSAQRADGAADQSVVPDLLLLRTAHRLLAQDHSRRHRSFVSIALLEHTSISHFFTALNCCGLPANPSITEERALSVVAAAGGAAPPPVLPTGRSRRLPFGNLDSLSMTQLLCLYLRSG